MPHPRGRRPDQGGGPLGRPRLRRGRTLTTGAGAVAGADADAAAVELAAGILGDRAQRLAPLGARTTYRVGGPAALLVEASGLADLAAVGAAHRASGLPVLVVGRGSNMLVADGGFAGIAVVLGTGEDSYGWVRIDGTTVSAGAAVALPTLARRSVEAGLAGLEWAVGVPGSVGGAVRMNAGGHGSDTSATLAYATVIDLDLDLDLDLVGGGGGGGGGGGVGGGPAPGPEGNWGAERLQHRYRSSAIGPAHVVTAGTFELRSGDRAAGAAELRSIVRWRRQHQPGGHNAGSVFTNPPGGVSAGELVERCGLRGARLGSAEVSSKHANFIQADDGGTAEDVDRLMRHVATTVARTAGVDLRSEIRRIGFRPQSQPLVEDQP